MSTLKVSKTDLEITEISVSSISPSDVSKTEDGSITYTYTYDSQRFSFGISGITTTDSQYISLITKLEQVSNADTFLFDMGSYGDAIVPTSNTITNNLYVEGAVAAGVSVIPYTDDTSAPGGVAPNGLLAVGVFVKMGGATYDKIYRVISVDTTNNTYTVFPSLRQAIVDETQILYGTDVMVRVRMTSDNMRSNLSGGFQTLRKFSLQFEEDYTSS